jgi:hypothetical protein
MAPTTPVTSTSEATDFARSRHRPITAATLFTSERYLYVPPRLLNETRLSPGGTIGGNAPGLDGVNEALMVSAVLIRVSARERRDGLVKLLTVP